MVRICCAASLFIQVNKPTWHYIFLQANKVALPDELKNVRRRKIICHLWILFYHHCDIDRSIIKVEDDKLLATKAKAWFVKQPPKVQPTIRKGEIPICSYLLALALLYYVFIARGFSPAVIDVVPGNDMLLTQATCIFQAGAVSGTLALKQSDDLLTINGIVNGLTAGLHSFHVHEVCLSLSRCLILCGSIFCFF